MAQTWQQQFGHRLCPLVQAERARLKAARPKGIGRPKATVVKGFLIFDDSVHVKPKGHRMGGLGQQGHDKDDQTLGGLQTAEGSSFGLGKGLPALVTSVPTIFMVMHADVSFTNLSLCGTSRIGTKYSL
jgi:hypothetical protein